MRFEGVDCFAILTDNNRRSEFINAVVLQVVAASTSALRPENVLVQNLRCGSLVVDLRLVFPHDTPMSTVNAIITALIGDSPAFAESFRQQWGITAISTQQTSADGMPPPASPPPKPPPKDFNNWARRNLPWFVPLITIIPALILCALVAWVFVAWRRGGKYAEGPAGAIAPPPQAWAQYIDTRKMEPISPYGTWSPAGGAALSLHQPLPLLLPPGQTSPTLLPPAGGESLLFGGTYGSIGATRRAGLSPLPSMQEYQARAQEALLRQTLHRPGATSPPMDSIGWGTATALPQPARLRFTVPYGRGNTYAAAVAAPGEGIPPNAEEVWVAGPAGSRLPPLRGAIMPDQ